MLHLYVYRKTLNFCVVFKTLTRYNGQRSEKPQFIFTSRVNGRIQIPRETAFTHLSDVEFSTGGEEALDYLSYTICIFIQTFVFRDTQYYEYRSVLILHSQED